MLKAKLQITLLATLFVSLAACGGGGSDNAYLTIVGDSNVFLDNNDIQTLRVRYHDSADDPLQGQVAFRLVGTTGGATLNRSSALTDDNGVVEVELRAGKSGSATFTIEATADYASAARWRISVGNGIPDLDPTGRYELRSKLDIISGLDNDAGDVINTFIDMTDDPNDPATWIIDQGIKQLPKDVANVLKLFRGAIDPAVNKLIMDNAPAFVQDLKDMGEALGDVTRNFGAVSILDIKKAKAGDTDDPDYLASHLMTGVFFDIRGTKYDWTLEELNVADVEAKEIPITKDNKNMLVIGNHAMPLTYGSIIVVALEQGIIPLFDDQADDLGDYLQNQVDCDKVGQSIYDNGGDEIPLTSPSTYEGLCEFGLEATAGLIIDQILKIDDVGVQLDIKGIARPRDTDGDRKPDRLQAGKWSGYIDYAGSQAEMVPENNTFEGVRLTTSK